MRERKKSTSHMSCKEICSDIFFPCWAKAFWVIELKDRHKRHLDLCVHFFSLLMVRLRRLIVWHHEKMLMHEKIFKSDLLKTSIAKLCDAFCLPWKFAHNFFFYSLTSFSVCRCSIFFSGYICTVFGYVAWNGIFAMKFTQKMTHKEKGNVQ